MNANEPVSWMRDWLSSPVRQHYIRVHPRSSAAKNPCFLITPHPPISRPTKPGPASAIAFGVGHASEGCRRASVAGQASQNNTELTEKAKTTEHTEKELMALRAKSIEALARSAI